jgi:hypothetical protein
MCDLWPPDAAVSSEQFTFAVRGTRIQDIISYCYVFVIQKLTTFLQQRLAFGTDLAPEDRVRLSTVLVRKEFVVYLRRFVLRQHTSDVCGKL